jgi:hypothetical protein
MRIAVLILAVMCAGAGPATTQSTEEKLRAINQQLRTQIAELKRENATLRKQVGQPATQPASPDGLAIGMTVEQVNATLGVPGRRVHKTPIQEDYEWEIWISPEPFSRFSAEQQRPFRDKLIIGTFINGKLTVFSEHE